MSTMGVPSIRSAPLTTMMGPNSLSSRISSILTQDMASGLGRKLERVAKTPRRALPPRRGGRTVGFQLSRMFSEKIHSSQRWLNPSSPRNASAFLNSFSKTMTDFSSFRIPLCLGIPNFSGKSLRMRATVLMDKVCMSIIGSLTRFLCQVP